MSLEFTSQRDYARIGEDKWPKPLREMAEFLAYRLRKSVKLPEAAASQKSANLIMRVSDAVGGLFVYLPNDEVRLREEINRLVSDFRSGAILPQDEEFTREKFCELMSEERHRGDACWWLLVRRVVAFIYPNEKLAGAPDDAAAEIAAQTIIAVAEYGAGKLFFLPVGGRVRAEMSHLEIAESLGRVDAKVLAFKYGVSQARVYAIAAKMRSRSRSTHAKAKAARG